MADANSYTINGTNITIRAGDCVCIRPEDPNELPYVARVEQLGTDHHMVGIRWYYRPEETKQGRKSFHGKKELFLSDHYDVQETQTIEGKCVVHSLDNYANLKHVRVDEYFSRFEYKAAKKYLIDVPVGVYCKCGMPYNPDKFMVQCDVCEDWFHPSCKDMTNKQAKLLKKFSCSDECSNKCSGASDPQRLNN